MAIAVYVALSLLLVVAQAAATPGQWAGLLGEHQLPAAGARATGKCPVLKPQANFDSTKFGSLWLVRRSTETTTRCVVIGLSAKGTSVTTKQYGVDDVSAITVANGVVTVSAAVTPTVSIVTMPTPGVYKFIPPAAGPGPAVETTFTVTSTDYTSYAVVVSCTQMGPNSRASVYVLSRGGPADSPVVKKALSDLSAAVGAPGPIPLLDTTCPRV